MERSQDNEANRFDKILVVLVVLVVLKIQFTIRNGNYVFVNKIF